MNALDLAREAPALPQSLEPRRLSRRARWIASGLVLTLVSAFAVLYARRYAEVKEVLQADREALVRARAALASAENALVTTRDDLVATGGLTADSDRRTDRRVVERELIDAAVQITREQIWDTGVSLDRTQQVLEQVLARAGEVSACLDGVAIAAIASGAGNDSGAVAALQGASNACRVALAAAAGAPYPYDFPDPYVLPAGDHYYAYSTNSGAGDIQVLTSSDLADWQIVGNGLAALPAWAVPDATWAPSVLPRPGGYVAYYTARDAGTGQQCITRARGASPSGPFLDDSTAPLVCRNDLGGSIDPSPFVDADGSAWLTWKNEANGTEPATIWSQRLSDDGLTLTGEAAPLLRADRGWERGIVEGPSLVRDGDVYYLFYSGADWRRRSYAIGWAACLGPQGPCTKPPGGPLVASSDYLAGPGGQEVFRDNRGQWIMTYHAYTEPQVGYPASRYLHFARVSFVSGAPIVDPPT